jgi:hypothetical protein
VLSLCCSGSAPSFLSRKRHHLLLGQQSVAKGLSVNTHCGSRQTLRVKGRPWLRSPLERWWSFDLFIYRLVKDSSMTHPAPDSPIGITKLCRPSTARGCSSSRVNGSIPVPIGKNNNVNRPFRTEEVQTKWQGRKYFGILITVRVHG